MHSLIYIHILSPLDPVWIEKPQNDTESITQARDKEALSRFYVTKLSIVLDLSSYGIPESKNMGCPFLNPWYSAIWREAELLTARATELEYV